MQYTNGSLFAEINPQMNTGPTMTKTPAQLIADALDAAMQTANNGKRMSQAMLSRMSGVPQPTISRTLSGKSIPEIATLAPLISVLGRNNVALASSIDALLPQQENLTPNKTIGSLAVPMFALPCPKCGKVAHKSFIELEMNDAIACECGHAVVVADYYGMAQLETILKSFGGIGFNLRKR